MSRSHRHSYVATTTAKQSERADKTTANRRLRHINRVLLGQDAEVLKVSNEVANTYRWSKDGYVCYLPSSPWHARCMRK